MMEHLESKDEVLRLQIKNRPYLRKILIKYNSI
jgi:hypothetical protein